MEQQEKQIVLSLDLARRQTGSIKDIWTRFKQQKLVYGEQVTLIGSCVTVRLGKAGKLLFIELMDGSTVRTLQCICDSAPDPIVPDEDASDKSTGSADPRAIMDWEPLFKHCSRGATVSLTGTIKKSPAKGQPIELEVTDYKCLGAIKEPEKYFLGQRGFINRDILRQVPHQRCQTQLYTAIQIVKQVGYQALHEAMAMIGIGEIQPTEITGNECEAGAHPFTVSTLFDGKMAADSPTKKDGTFDWTQDFFGKRVYLTVSSQLHLEATVLSSKRDSYCCTVAFRAEPSTGPLHMAEFIMPEWELVGGGLQRNMAVAQTVLKHMFEKVLKECPDELEFLEAYRHTDDDVWYAEQLSSLKEVKKDVKAKKCTKQDLEMRTATVEAEFKRRKGIPSIVDRLTRYTLEPFAITTHEECVRRMLADVEAGKVKFDVQPSFDDDLTRQHEYYISEVIFGGIPTFVRYFPKKIKAFYMPVIKEDTPASRDGVEHVEGYDLICPFVGEIVGGSQRIDSEQELVSRMHELGMNLEELQWYIDLRAQASLPHGGAGMGLGRVFVAMCGIHNIKDMSEFPRAAGHKCFA